MGQEVERRVGDSRAEEEEEKRGEREMNLHSF